MQGVLGGRLGAEGGAGQGLGRVGQRRSDRHQNALILPLPDGELIAVGRGKIQGQLRRQRHRVLPNVAARDSLREGQPVGAGGRVHNVVLCPGFTAVAVLRRDLGARGQVDLGLGAILIVVVEHQVEALGQALVTGVVLELLGTFFVLELDGCIDIGDHRGVSIGDQLQLAVRRGQAHCLLKAGGNDNSVLVPVPGKAVVGGIRFAGGQPLGGQTVSGRVRQPVVTGEQNVQQPLFFCLSLNGQIVPLG